MNKDYKLNMSLFAVMMLGHLVLALEIFLEHFEHLKYNKFAWIPIVWGLVCGILSLCVCLRVFYSTAIIKILMSISFIVGLLGLYFHNEWRLMSIIDVVKSDLPVTLNLVIGYTPLLAPSAFCALSLIGFLSLKADENNI